MSNPEFGTKHTCEACAERFYDLRRSPVICFKCGVQQSPPKPRMYRPIRAGSERGVFSRRPLPMPAEKEPADELAVEEVEEADLTDNEDTDLDDETEVEIEVDIDPEDGKIIA